MKHLPVPPPDYEALFQSSPNLYLVLTPQFRIAAANEAYCRATLTRCEQIVGRVVFDVFPDNPADPAATGISNLRQSLERVLQSHAADSMGIQKYDIPLPGSDGAFEERYWSPLNLPVLGEDGKVRWILNKVEDVTELVRLQIKGATSAKVSVEQLETIAQLRDANHTLALQNEENVKLEQSLAARAAELQNEIAVRKEAEQKLQESTVFLDAVIEHLPALLFVKDAKDHRFILQNRAGLELLGYAREEIIGKSDYDLFPKEQADHFVARDQEVLNSKKVQITPEEPIQTRHKGTRLLRTTKVPVLNDKSEPLYLLGFCEDITERKSTEQQLRQAVKMEAVGQLTGGVAHDFNNLLGVVIGNLDLAISRTKSDAATQDLLEGALDGALRGAELVQRLLAFSRKQPLQPAAIDLNERLPQIVKMLQRTIGEHIEIAVANGADLWSAYADPAQTDEVILNLAINARDAMPRGGRLSIETANVQLDADYAAQNIDVTLGDYVSLVISDTGTGMAPEVIERAFEPFFTTKDVEKGTGLGLSMVYGFVKQSGGHVKIYSEVGHGTSVKIYLPRALPQGVAEAAGQSIEPEKSKGRELILLVEDDDGMRNVALKQLTDLQYRTLVASNGKEALKVLESHPEVKLLFTDVIMPGGMTGFELAKAAQQRLPNLKVLLTSGYTAHAMASGFNDLNGMEFLKKPFRRTELADKLQNIFRNGAA